MISSGTSGAKCLKNLDIVMESADEGQALLLAADATTTSPTQPQQQQNVKTTTKGDNKGAEAVKGHQQQDGQFASGCHEIVGEQQRHHCHQPNYNNNNHQNYLQQLQQQQNDAHTAPPPLLLPSQQQQHAPSSKMKPSTNAITVSDSNDDEEDKVTPTSLKGRNRKTVSNNNNQHHHHQQQQQQPSRVERSRLSVITFLNNITAPPPMATRTDAGKSWRSLSMSGSSLHHHHQQNHHHQQQQQQQVEPNSVKALLLSEKQQQQKMTNNSETAAAEQGEWTIVSSSSGGGGHRLTKSLCGSAADELQQHQHQQTHHQMLTTGVEQHAAVGCSGGPLDGASSTTDKGTGGGGGGNVMLADRLSIKSGASSTSSSGCHSESHSNLSVGGGGKQMKARECPVCYIRQHPSNFHKLQTCSHLTCKTCLIKYLNLEIMESRTNISCPNCTALLHASDIYALLEFQPDLLDRFEMFALRRALSTDPDARWCPAPDCGYAVIAYSCAACPQLKCERCTTMFCYHCKNNWHPNQTCDQARAKLTGGALRGFAAQAAAIITDTTSTSGNDVTKACPRCGVQIMKMNDGSCNHMQCVLCNAEFCWLCLKQINELHYLSPTGCTFWGKKPWTRKKKLLWQVGTLIGAPLGIALIAGLAVPGIICGVPIFVGRKIYQRFANLSKMKRRLVTVLGVFGSLIVSPVLAVLTVGVGVPIMLAYVYGVVPLSLCRNGGCGGGGSASPTNSEELLNAMSDFDVAYGEESATVSPTAEPNESASQNDQRLLKTKCNSSNSHHQPAREDEKTSTKSSFHHRRQSIASSGLVSLTDKVNTEDASIQAIAGSQYNFDSRSVHTVWSSGQYGLQLGAVELAQEATSYNNEDAENSSTLACCSASIVAQASERRSLTGSNGSIRNVRPRSSISNSGRANSEEKGKLLRKASQFNFCKDQQGNVIAMESEGGGVVQHQPGHSRRGSSQSASKRATVAASAAAVVISTSPTGGGSGNTVGNSSSSSGTSATVRRRTRISLRSFLRHPVNSIFGSKSVGVKI